MRVLLVANDSLHGQAVCNGLQQQGNAVDWVQNSTAAESAVVAHEYAALVLDIDLADSAALLRRLHGRRENLPVILITDREGIAGLARNVDDFIVKPVDTQELGARLEAVVRRASDQVGGAAVHGLLKVDPATRAVILDDKPVMLTAREFAILMLLLESRGRVISKQQLQEALYSWRDEIESNAVEVHVHHLRRKLGRELIKTMHGMGYMIDERIQTG